MKISKASALTRDQFKAACKHFSFLQGGYCAFAHIRCDMEYPKPCQRLFRYDLLYGDYKRKRPRGSNIPKSNRHAHPDLFPPDKPPDT